MRRRPIAIEIEHFVDIIAGLAILFWCHIFHSGHGIGYTFLRAYGLLLYGHRGSLCA